MSNVFDDFNRADSPLSLGTATSGQTWSNVGSAIWGVGSNAADCAVDTNPGLAVISSGFRNTVVQATVLDVTAGGNLNSNNWGLIFCYEDPNNWYRIAYDAFEPHFMRLSTFIAGVFITNYAPPHVYIPVNGDVIAVENCGRSIRVTVNGAELYAVSHLDFEILNGVSQGLFCGQGVVTPPQHARWDDFSAVSNGSCDRCCVVPTSHADLQILASQVTPTSFTNLTNVTNVGGSLFRSGGVGGTLDAFADSVNMVDGDGCAYWEYRQFFSDLTTNNLTAIWLTDEFDGPNQYGHIFNNFFGLQRVAWHHGTTTDFSLFYGPTNGDPNQVGRTVGFRFCIYYNNGNVWLDQNAQDTTNTEDFESISGGGQPFIVPNDRRWKVRVYVIPDSVEGAHSPLVTERIANINDICPTGWILPPIGWHATGEVVPALPPQSNSTVRFDSGEGPTPWYLVPQLSDSGNELRAKSLKSVRVTGKVTSAKAKGYGYPILTGISTDDLETGENSETGPVPLPDTEQVTRGERKQIRVPNARLHTVRVEGEWDGTNDPDRVDEVSYEWTEKGVRE